jgi:two-component system nitrogen regulation sensor histidine kinase NtrY
MNATKRPAKPAPFEGAEPLTFGDGVGAVYAAPWPVAGERRARRGSSPVYQSLKLLFLGLALLAVVLLGTAAVVVGWNSNLSGASYLAMTIALVILAGLAGIYVLRRLVVLVLDRRGRLKGGSLHRRILGVLTLVALLPALAVGTVGIVIFNQGVDDWFANTVLAAQEAGQQVAEGYVNETSRSLLAETSALAQEPLWQIPPLLLSEATAATLLRSQQTERGLDELTLTDETGQPLATASGLPGVLPHELLNFLQSSGALRGNPKFGETFRQANGGRVLAAVPLQGGRWLVAERSLPPSMQAHLENLQSATAAYQQLAADRSAVRRNLSLLMVVLLLGCVAVAIWAGQRLAKQLAGPITDLVHGTNRVSAGDLSVRLNPRDDDELGTLTQAFNRMTQQLATNADLVERKNEELDARRRLTEAVLLGVSAGVVAVDEAGVVRLANPSATNLLKIQTGDKLAKHSPELSEVLRAFHAQLYDAEVHQRKLIQSHTLKVAISESETKTLQVRLLPIGGELGKSGVVLTFDDITPLMGAQRLAAWQDVARRLAHEIKNPLTPIQLSAARMKRKFIEQIAKSDQPLFGQLADTVVNAAEEMRRMVNEFSDFARMPQAQRVALPLGPLVAEVVALQSSREGVKICLEDRTTGVQIEADSGQLQRVLTNLIENASNAVAEREGTNLPQGRVEVVVQMPQADRVALEIHDNGRGLPEGKRVEELFDPYVTTRKNGTGLGLAIVKKVMDEHGGTVRLARRESGGTVATLTLPALAGSATQAAQPTKHSAKKDITDDHAPEAPDARNSHRRRRG